MFSLPEVEQFSFLILATMTASWNPLPQVQEAMPPRAPRPRPAQRPNAVQPAQVRPKVVVITDPGPDPNDVKALLVLAMAHAHAQIELAAVVANGGAHPARRAQLARLILDRVGESAVPVGVGSAGTFVPEQPHECAMRGFGAVDRARLLDGQALLARTLRRATRSSVTMLLISGLRDFADLVAAQPDLVLRKVRAVTIQAGLVPDAASPYGYAPDTSQNNAFDVQAAAAVFAFCFSRGLRMIVVSRHAVPVRRARAAPRALPRAPCRVRLHPPSTIHRERPSSSSSRARAASPNAARALVCRT